MYIKDSDYMKFLKTVRVFNPFDLSITDAETKSKEDFEALKTFTQTHNINTECPENFQGPMVDTNKPYQFVVYKD